MTHNTFASTGPHRTHHTQQIVLSCIETHTSTGPHSTHRIISNAYMRCVLMTSYRMRTMRAMRIFPCVVGAFTNINSHTHDTQTWNNNLWITQSCSLRESNP
ncbi:hypothetical protein SFRURICE_003018 [Spodoptera frugiperda]|nr:hypothetical protein SFRURICE_003018 [Spodoptera frugiperda]